MFVGINGHLMTEDDITQAYDYWNEVFHKYFKTIGS